MALKKSELYSSLWQSCDELRGSMDASQYKDYVLVLLFIKYVILSHGVHFRRNTETTIRKDVNRGVPMKTGKLDRWTHQAVARIIRRA